MKDTQCLTFTTSYQSVKNIDYQIHVHEWKLHFMLLNRTSEIIDSEPFLRETTETDEEIILGLVSSYSQDQLWGAFDEDSS